MPLPTISNLMLGWTIGRKMSVKAIVINHPLRSFMSSVKKCAVFEKIDPYFSKFSIKNQIQKEIKTDFRVLH